MRIARLPILLICALTVGCASRDAASQRQNAGLLLDNHGGFSHGGRRLALSPDGSYRDTTYSDVVGDEHTRRGHYTFDAARRHLTLSPEQGGQTDHWPTDLYLVRYGDRQYWVTGDERTRITQAGETWLRQTALSVVP
jgi:hypothetical protein